MEKDIDKEFEEFVKNNYGLLTNNQKDICKKLGIVDAEADNEMIKSS